MPLAAARLNFTASAGGLSLATVKLVFFTSARESALATAEFSFATAWRQARKQQDDQCSEEERLRTGVHISSPVAAMDTRPRQR